VFNRYYNVKTSQDQLSVLTRLDGVEKAEAEANSVAEIHEAYRVR